MAGLAFAVMTRTPPDLLGSHFLARSYTEGGGTNVVNVILVDFRGFDTLGEITVLGAVALTVFALLRRFRPAADSVDIPEQQRDQNAYDAAHPDRREGDTVADWLLVPSLIARFLFPVIGLVALFLLLRGHDLPGGGFTAGLTAAIALILQYMIGGTWWVEHRLRVQPLRWIGLGLLIAATTGLGALVFGRPFMTSSFSYADLPVIGQVPMASALLFDIGVFALVVGATALMLIALAHQSVRGHRAVHPSAAGQPDSMEPAATKGNV
jgi:multicomponent K+:H+ antiporter subunit A